MSRKLDKKMYTPREVAEILGVGEKWVREIHREGLQASVEAGAHLLIPRPVVIRMRQYFAEPNCYNSPYRINFSDWLRAHDYSLSKVVYATEVTASKARPKSNPGTSRVKNEETIVELADLYKKISDLEHRVADIENGGVEKERPKIVSIDRGLIEKEFRRYVMSHLPEGHSQRDIETMMKKIKAEAETSYLRKRTGFHVMAGKEFEDRRRSRLNGQTFPEWLEENGLLSDYMDSLPAILTHLDHLFFGAMFEQQELGL